MTSLSPFSADPMDFDRRFQDQLGDVLFGIKPDIDKEYWDELRNVVDPETKSQVMKDLEEIRLGKQLKIADWSYTLEPASSDYYEILDRAMHAQLFTSQYKFSDGLKIYIAPGEMSGVCGSDYCFDSTWIGVYGLQSICMVTCRDMDMTPLHPSYQTDGMKLKNMQSIARATISEVECLPHQDIDHYNHDLFHRQYTPFAKNAHSAKKPFAVVSLCVRAFAEYGHPLECSKRRRLGASRRRLDARNGPGVSNISKTVVLDAKP